MNKLSVRGEFKKIKEVLGLSDQELLQKLGCDEFITDQVDLAIHLWAPGIEVLRNYYYPKTQNELATSILNKEIKNYVK